MNKMQCVDCEVVLNAKNHKTNRNNRDVVKRCGKCYLVWKAEERKREGRL